KTIIVSTVPVLMFIYPLAVVMIVLLFTNNWFEGRQCVYVWTVGLTFVMAFMNGLETAGLMPDSIESVLQTWVPLHSVGMGWIGFAVVGYAIGLVWKKLYPVK
ncbi:MAG TPA: branched-chain amino acid transport system II carrier protein, partial [Candidatus Aphodousia faecipullorum]|nr:branched-chain amino acid transport system II carrier protein [Candidatus Aphodousia faecipullorum]